jgi:hypothetical protein
MTDCSNPDFKLGNMTTELVDYTIGLCNKDENKTPRFPQRLYNSYVSKIVTLSIEILEGIFVTNAIRDTVKSKEIR